MCIASDTASKSKPIFMRKCKSSNSRIRIPILTHSRSRLCSGLDSLATLFDPKVLIPAPLHLLNLVLNRQNPVVSFRPTPGSEHHAPAL